MTEPGADPLLREALSSPGVELVMMPTAPLFTFSAQSHNCPCLLPFAPADWSRAGLTEFCSVTVKYSTWHAVDA